jgi:hypothetical protein
MVAFSLSLSLFCRAESKEKHGVLDPMPDPYVHSTPYAIRYSDYEVFLENDRSSRV